MSEACRLRELEIDLQFITMDAGRLVKLLEANPFLENLTLNLVPRTGTAASLWVALANLQALKYLKSRDLEIPERWPDELTESVSVPFKMVETLQATADPAAVPSLVQMFSRLKRLHLVVSAGANPFPDLSLLPDLRALVIRSGMNADPHPAPLAGLRSVTLERLIIEAGWLVLRYDNMSDLVYNVPSLRTLSLKVAYWVDDPLPILSLHCKHLVSLRIFSRWRQQTSEFPGQGQTLFPTIERLEIAGFKRPKV
jgi:hypothetical protein